MRYPSAILKIATIILTFSVIAACSDSSISESNETPAVASSKYKSNSVNTSGESLPDDPEDVYTDEPPAIDFQNEKNAVVTQHDTERVSTATFINTINNNGKLFFLAAWHANMHEWWRTKEDYDKHNVIHDLLDVGDKVFRQLIIHNERTNTPQIIYVTVIVRAISDRSDIVLFEVENPSAIPKDALDKIYLLGWDARDDAFGPNKGGVIIGHGGSKLGNEFKKIAQYWIRTMGTDSWIGPESFTGNVYLSSYGLQKITRGFSNSMLISNTSHLAVAFLTVANPTDRTVFGGVSFKGIYSDPNFKRYLDPESTGSKHLKSAYYHAPASTIINDFPRDKFQVISKFSESNSDIQFCLDGKDGSKDPGAEMISWRCHGGNNQLWEAVQQKGNTGFYQLCSKNSRLCLSYTDDSNTIKQMQSSELCTADRCYWKFDESSRIANYSNSKCLTVNANRATTAEDCSTTAENQKFSFYTAKRYLIKNIDSGKCLDVKGASNSIFQNIITWDCHRSPSLNQQWIFMYTGTPTSDAGSTAQLCSALNYRCIANVTSSDSDFFCKRNSDHCYLTAEEYRLPVFQTEFANKNNPRSASVRWALDSQNRIVNADTKWCLTMGDLNVTRKLCSMTDPAQKWRLEEVRD